MWLIRQTREQQARGFIRSLDTKGNKADTDTANNIGIRGIIGIGDTGDLGDLRYKIVLLSEQEKMMRQQRTRDGQGLKPVDADFEKRSGTGRRVDGRIRILKRKKGLSPKRKVDGKIRILRRGLWYRST